MNGRKRNRARAPSFVPRMVFKTLVAAVVPAIAACEHHEQRAEGVAYQVFATSGARSEPEDAGNQSDMPTAVDAWVADSDRTANSGNEMAPTGLAPTVPPDSDRERALPVASYAFGNNRPPAPLEVAAEDAGVRRPRRRR